MKPQPHDSRLSRRTFLRASAAGALAAAAGPHLARAATGKAVLKLCSQEGRLPGKSLEEKLENLRTFGGVGVELGGNPANRVDAILKAARNAGVGIAALCWGSHNGDLVSTDADRRAKGIDALKAALETAGRLGSTGVIFVPCFNGQSDLKPPELDKIMLDILPEIGEHAVKVKSRVLLEPLNKGETFYLNRLEQALAICEKVASPGICLMGDFYHMCKEEKDDEAAFVAAGAWCHHVHLASRVRWLPGQDRLKEPDKPERSFVAGFRGLKRIGYTDYCSLECGCKGDPMAEIPKSFALLKRQWEEATV
jgi:sugar phosphate isomerase/epimerase